MLFLTICTVINWDQMIDIVSSLFSLLDLKIISKFLKVAHLD